MTPSTTDTKNLFDPLSLMEGPFNKQQEQSKDFLKNNPVTKAVTHAVADAVTDVVTDAVTDVVVNNSPFAMAQKSMNEVSIAPALVIGAVHPLNSAKLCLLFDILPLKICVLTCTTMYFNIS